MTGNKYMVRCRRRHKVHSGEWSDSGDPTTTMDNEDPLPSTSSSLNHAHLQQRNPLPPSQPSVIVRDSEDRISRHNLDVDNHHDYTENPDDVEDYQNINSNTMRRRRLIGRCRHKEMTSNRMTSSESPATKCVSSFIGFRSASALLLLVSLSAIVQPCLSLEEVRCGPIDIRNKPWGFRAKYSQLGDTKQIDSFYNTSSFKTFPPSEYTLPCTVIEGSLSISFIYNVRGPNINDPENKIFEQTDYPRFPDLREITGTLLVFETYGLTDLGYVFPNLRVIGGQRLVQHYSLIIYANNDLLQLNLPKLSVIRNGGVRVQNNKKCCHVQTIGWKNMIASTVNDVIVDNAADYAVTETGIVCQKGTCQEDVNQTSCRYLQDGEKRIQSCWNDTTCQLSCPHDRQNSSYFGPGCSPRLEMCHEQCIGGCDTANDSSTCSACRNVFHDGSCVEKCPPGLYTLMGRRCVTKDECLALNPTQKNVPVRIKATAGVCSDKCPQGWEINPNDASTCKKCDGKCEIKCPLNHKIDTFGKAQALQHCHIIEGNLTIEIRGKTDSGMAAKLKEFFAEIHTITGYLQVMRSPPLLSLGLFKKLKMVRGDSLFMNQFAISVIDNQNLRQLFEDNTRLRIGNKDGTIQVHNNRMLCFSVVEKLVSQLGVPLNETFQSVASNGDKAICQDANIDIRVVAIGGDFITFEWDAFDTSDSDFRKFLGYEFFYKEVEKPDPNMSIDDDRSACVDSWNSVFIQHMEPSMPEYGSNVTRPPKKETTTLNAMNQKIQPNTVYAYYAATQMVHHPGAKNGMSKIGFVKTKFTPPEHPILTVTAVETNAIKLAWEPPRRPNGDITHYTIAWRELDVDVHTEALKLCNLAGTAINLIAKDESLSRRDDTADTSPAQNTVSHLTGTGNDTCSATKGCCVCSAESSQTSAAAKTYDSVQEQAKFENNLIDIMITNTLRCDYEKDPIGCALRASPPEVHMRGVDNDDEPRDDEDVDDGEARIKRNTEAMQRRRRQILMGDEYGGQQHAIRGADRRQYERFSALIIEDARTKRSIQDAEEMDKKLGKEKKKKVTKSPRKTTTTTAKTTVATPTENEEEEKQQKVVVDEILFAGGRWEINVAAKEFDNSFVLSNLKHYTSYSITISACQNQSVPDAQCSTAHKAGTLKKTLPRQGIDTINAASIDIVPFGTDEEPGNVRVTWDPPRDSNGGVLGYLLTMDSPGASPSTKCVPNTKGFSPRDVGTEFWRLSEGVWTVKIHTVSVSGEGPAVAWTGSYEVMTPSFWLWWRLAGAALTVLLAIVLIAAVVFYNVKYKFGKRVKKLADFMHLNPEYCVDDKYTMDDWEIAKSDVTQGEMIGEGTFGKVYLGVGKNLVSVRGDHFGACAIKMNTVRDPAAPENMNYLMEANVMKNFKAAFVVKLYGVISTIHPAWVIMEHMELGNLRDYLRSKRENEVFDENDCNFYDVVPRAKLCEWAAQVCDGMAYLESLKFCHRDLAARNCMIDKNELVKIGDFGMARDLFYHDYYKPSGKRMMPVRWMSPESLKDGKFDSKSDVWAFGVVLYEIVTLGAQPYIGLSNDEVLNYISMARKVIKQPDCCSDYWYKIMKMCWRFAPRDRPTFLQLVHLLSAEASEEFKTLSFVFTENQMAMEDSEPLDLDEVFNYQPPEEPVDPSAMDLVVAEEGRRMTDSIPMREFRSDQMAEGNSHSTISSVGSTVRPSQRGARQRSLDDEYMLMNHSRVPSDTAEIRPFTGDHGDYVERDVAADVPTRRNTGNSDRSYTGGAFCMPNRGGSNERAGFGEGLRLTDGIGSGHHLHDDDYGDGMLNSMDTRRSTGASTASYGVPHQTNWSGSQTKGATFYENKKMAAAQAAAAAALAARQKAQMLAEGRGDRLVQLPGVVNGTAAGSSGASPAVNGVNGHGADGDYVETEGRALLRNNEGSPSRNGNFNRPRTAFNERDRLIEDHET